MRIEIVCHQERYCDLLKARVNEALGELQLTAEVEYVMDHIAQEALETEVLAGLVIDGQLIAIGTGHSADDIRRMILLHSSATH